MGKLEGLKAKKSGGILKKKESGLRGKLLSSGFGSYAEDEDDVEGRRAYDSDDAADVTLNSNESEWKKIQKKMEEPKGKVKGKLKSKSQGKNPAVDALFR